MRGSKGKEFARYTRDPGSVPGSGRCPGEGASNPLQYSCLESPMDRGAWQAPVLWVAKLDPAEQLTLPLQRAEGALT